MILVISSKDAYGTKRLFEEARKQKVEIRILDIEELVDLKFKVDISEFDALYIRNPYHKTSPKYIPQIINLAKKFKAQGKMVVDANIASGKLGQGKWEDYKQLKKAGVLIPKTKQYKSAHYSLPTIHYILKWIYGMKGKGTFLVKSNSDIKKIPAHIPKEELMWQEFIKADFEYKVICVGYKSIPVVLKFAMNKLNRPDFRNFFVLKSSACTKVLDVAQKASKVLGRELSKVDILEKDGKFYVLEVNRFPGLDSFEKLTKFNVFSKFLSYLSSIPEDAPPGRQKGLDIV